MTEKNIYTALLASQKAMGPLLKNATNPHFRNKYADLSQLIETVSEPLQANGIAWFQPIETWTDGVATVNTVLVHADSGTQIESKVPIVSKDPNNPQAMGAAITYARRYGLMAMCGLAPEDDDGNAAAAPRNANGNGNVPRNTPQTFTRATESDVSSSQDSGHPRYDGDEARASNRMATDKQLKMIYAVSRSIGYDNDDMKAILSNEYNVESSKDLTMTQATKLIDWLKAKEAAQG